MQIRKVDTIEHVNSDTCIASEYPFQDKDLNIADIQINGRYPETGFCMNEKVKEIVYVIEGSGIICIDDKIYEVTEGDAFLYLPGQKVFYEGEMRVLTACTPAWTPEQHKVIE